MYHEQFEIGKSAPQIIQETIEDLEQGLYDAPERDVVRAKLLTARALTLPGTKDHKKIEELLSDIDTRYGEA
jgi:hypothetical protein